MVPLRDGLEGLPAVAFDCDATGALVSISGYWSELTGQSQADALGAGWGAHLDLERLRADLSQLREVLQRGDVVHHALRFKDRHGRWGWLRSVSRAQLKADAVVGLRGVATLAAGEQEDVPARVRLEEAEHRVERLESLLAVWPDLLFQVSPDGVYTSYRASDPGWLYTAPENFLGSSFEQVLPPNVARLSREALEGAKATGQQQQFFYDLQLASGVRDFECRVQPTRSGEYLFVIRDITDTRRRQAELEHAREDALERSRLKTQFLANVSHEIRTPLNGILGVTQLLKQQSLPAELSEYVEVLQGAGESLLAIVNDVLDLSRIEANKLELEPRPFDLEQLLADAVRSFRAVVQRKGLELAVEVAEDARGPVRGDPARIRQIINNLVGNAVKFTDAGAVKVTAARVRGDWVRITVRDTGPGIAPAHQERIFEAFEQADVGVQRRFGGTGLGLAITRQLARLMGGEVSLHSALGAGATFQLELPLPSVVIAHGGPPISRVTPAPRALRVLLAEDDAVNASMTAALLRKLGHQVRVVPDGQACVEVARGGEVDLVLMDVQMPVLNGLEATRAIREAERAVGTHLPIVALTANAMKGDDLTCLSAGMDAYLAKPVTVTALKDLLLWFGSREA